MPETLIRSSFQELMHQWERDYPYNFVCIADVRGTLEHAALRQAALDTLGEMRIGIVHFASKRRYWYELPSDVEIQWTDDVETNAVVELNRPFTDGRPLRIVVERPRSNHRGVDAPERAAVAITFRHVAFDGQSGSIFARRMLLRAIGVNVPPMETARHPRGRDWLADGYAWLHPFFCTRIVRDLWTIRSVYSRGRRAALPDVDVRFLQHDALLLTRVRRDADAPGMTVNDALASRFAKGLLYLLKDEFTKQRHTIGLTMAVSLRRGVAPLARGICVAAFPVFVRSGADVGRVIQQQTDIEKRSRAYLRSLLGIATAAASWSVPRRPRRPNMVASYVPTAGFSNVRVPALEGDEFITNVRAVASTGPFLPLMLIAVTHGDELRLSLSWRRDLFTPDEISFLEETLTR